LLCTGVPVVGRLQARWERRRGLQVPSGVIEVGVGIVGEGREHAIDRYLLSRLWCRVFCLLPRGEGDHLPFIDQGEGDVQARRTIRLHAEVWRTVLWR
jgi:hypothetical protein